jgi:hypothetical protein
MHAIAGMIENGEYREAPASVDTHPTGGDSAQTEAPFMSGAVPAAEQADAQTPPNEHTKGDH